MDTRSKNINEDQVAYEEMVKDCRRIKLAKMMAIVIMAIMISISVISFRDVKSNRGILDQKGLYGNQFLGSEINTFTQQVINMSDLYKNEEYIKDSNNLTNGEIAWKKENIKYKIDEEYSNEVGVLHENYETGEWSEEKSNQEENAIYKRIQEKYTYTDEELKNLIIEEKLAEFNRNLNLLNSYENLKFITYDKGNNIWITNYESGKEAIVNLKEESGYFAEYHISGGNQKRSITINGEQLKEKELQEYNNEYSSSYIKTNTRYKDEDMYNHYSEKGFNITSDLDIYISVPEKLVAGDSIYSTYDNFSVAIRDFNNELQLLIGSVLGIIIMAFILKKIKDKPCYLNGVMEKLKDITLEFKLLGLLLAYIARDILFRYGWRTGYIYDISLYNIILVAILLLIYYIVIKSIIQSYKDKTILKGSYFIKLYEVLNIAMEKGSFGRKLTLLIGAYLLICISVSFVLCLGLGGVGLVIAIGFCIIVTAIFLFKLIKEFAYLNKIATGARMISEGKMSADISEEGKGELKGLANSINNIKQGLRKSIENENKSERMKTELISNVSHDLKTPLTSIINYVDLLKRAEIEPEEARAYVDVLDKKSQRLKILIEDLFEASKAASGAMSLTLTKVEVGALLRQSLGEAEKRIEEAKLDFKINIPQEKIYINADGRKIWRVFENLILNAIKYSLTGTRVYIDVKVNEDKVYIITKNISAFELNFDANEITERFKRGEESRHTDGSGLGLAIAKNIVELHGGNFNVEIDGDLFKATVELDRENVDVK